MNSQNLSFGQVLEALLNGDRAAREGWNGKSMWIAYSPGMPSNPAEKFWSPAVRAFAKRKGITHINVRPYIVMYTVDGEIVPWLASQSDVLATDWELLA